MKELIQLLFILLLPGVIVTSCNDKDDTSQTAEVPVALSAGIHTRAADTSWHPGDQIGVAMLKTESNEIIGHKCNCKYTTASGDGFFSALSENILYYPLNGDKVDLIAYYPHVTNHTSDHCIKIDVANQANLPGIDLMTSNRVVGASKNNPAVSMDFTHKLTKLQFKLKREDNTLKKNIKSLVIKGMNTTATFGILTGELSAYAEAKNIEVPVNNSETATAIVLPREAGSGVSFTITLDDNTEYAVAMKDDMELKTATKYTFTITLRDKQTPVTISTTISDWKEGAHEVIVSQPIMLEQEPGVSSGFSENDVIDIYHENTTITSFTYTNGNWVTDTPVYWENIGDGESQKLTLRAQYIRSKALHDTQLPEVAVCEQEVTRFESLNFDFKLAPAKAVFVLTSASNDADETFTAEELKTARISLPSYITGYTLEHGVFNPLLSPIGGITAVDGIALIVPQTKRGFIAIVTIGNNSYTISDDDGIEFKAGVATKITINILKTKLKSVSASYNDWEDDDTVYNKEVMIVAPEGTTSNFVAGNAFSLYTTENNNGSQTDVLLATYTYNGMNSWSSDKAVYWDNLENNDQYTFYATCTLHPAPANSNQMDDLMYAECSGVSRYGLIELPFTKKSAKVIIKLKSDDKTFSTAELESATVILPDYMTGARFDGKDYITGTTKKDVTLAKVKNELTWTGLIQPQSIASSANLVQVKIGNSTYPVKSALNFEAATAYTLTIDMKKTGATFSASYAEWTPGSEHHLTTELEE